MSTVADVITDARVELVDGDSSRWTDANFVTLIKKCVRRANFILSRRNIDFAKSTDTFSTVSGTTTYALPSDFMAPADGLFRRDNNDPLTLISDGSYEELPDSPSEISYWRINGSNIEIIGSPTQAVSMILYYWPEIDTSAYATSTTMPWAGRIDDIISEYLTLRCKNIDEMDISFDQMFMKEIENGYLGMYTARTGRTSTVRGYHR